MQDSLKWDPDRYERFRRERERPGLDLIEMVEVRPDLDVVDLGCGTGRLTRALADRLPGARVLGLDRSEEMLARAAAHARPGLRFERGDLATALDGAAAGPWDLIWSNAALQWHPDHHALIPRLFSRLAAGGQLAFQVPSNADHPVTRIRREVLARFDRDGRFDGVPSSGGTLPLHAYAEILHHLGAEQIEVIQRIYLHVLPDAESIVEWQSGTALLPYLQRLDDDAERARLHAELTDATRALHPGSPVPFAFQRTFVSARRGAAG